MATQRQIEANRKNALKSTGPKTPEGKIQSRLNAIKHGMTAKTPILPGEDPDVFQQRISTWKAELKPQNSIETYLAERAARVSWQLDRADRAQSARLASQFRHSSRDLAQKEDEEVVELGRQLFWDPRGPIALYPHSTYRPGMPRVSWTGEGEGDPEHPSMIVTAMEATELGCLWLLDRWAELENLIDMQVPWQGPDKLKAIRLLGKHPIEAVDDPQIASLFLACHVIDPRGGEVFYEIWNEINAAEIEVYKQRLAWREIETLRPTDKTAAFALLDSIVQSARTRLEADLVAHRATAKADEKHLSDHHAFDDSLEGERLRRFQMAANGNLLRTLDTVVKLRRFLEPKGSASGLTSADGIPGPANGGGPKTIAEQPASPNARVFPSVYLPTMPVIAAPSAFDASFCFSTGTTQALVPGRSAVSKSGARAEPDRKEIASVSTKAKAAPVAASASSGAVDGGSSVRERSQVIASRPAGAAEAVGLSQATLTPSVREIGEASGSRVLSKPRTMRGAERPSDRADASAVSEMFTAEKPTNPRAARLAKLVELTTCSMDDAKLRPPYLRRQRLCRVAAQTPGRIDCSSAAASISGL